MLTEKELGRLSNLKKWGKGGEEKKGLRHGLSFANYFHLKIHFYIFNITFTFFI